MKRKFPSEFRERALTHSDSESLTKGLGRKNNLVLFTVWEIFARRKV